jgi:alkylated DNA repair dioxygenase AlkB
MQKNPNVDLIRNFLTTDRADALVERIHRDAEFKQNYIQMFGTKAVPRLEAWYADWSYDYAKGVTLPVAPIPDYLLEVIRDLKAGGFGEYNGVLINKYRHGKDHISPHSDDDYGTAEPTIASITLGATRPFRMARIISGARLDKSTTVEYLLAHGDLLIMRGRTNLEWQHWVPQTAKPVGERLNLTFRLKNL